MITEEQIFDECQRIYGLNDEEKANELFKLLDKISNKQGYPPILNHLIREIGIYPYIKQETAIFVDRFACECFKTDTGEKEHKILHREQSKILKLLLNGEDLILSAPTSFGKSFIIDALIAIKKPNNILIVVPTISLMDETRRRLTLKFSNEYHIVTTINSQLKDKNILIFPQERALEYFENIKEKGLDLFVVDEFYKISPKSESDKARSSILQHVILKYSKIALQKYYLCPNINEIKQRTPFSEGMKFIPISTNTVFINIIESYGEESFDKNIKLYEVLDQNLKTLIYTKSQNTIKDVCDVIAKRSCETTSSKLQDFSNWLQKYYGEFYLIDALKNSAGIHHGKLHRCLSQIQVRLFEEHDGLKTIISTSSLIEGINIPAKNLILWNKHNGNSKLDGFTYKNIIGRSGRMFKYFVGNVYLFEEPENQDEGVLEIEVQVDSMLMDEAVEQELPDNKQKEIKSFKKQMIQLIGKEQFNKLKTLPKLKNGQEVLIELVKLLKNKDFRINALKYLLNDQPEQWLFLKKMAKIKDFHIKSLDIDMVKLIKNLSQNWNLSIPHLVEESKLSLDIFFQVEKHVAFKVASLFADINTLIQAMFPNPIDISPFVNKLSNVFLPSVVYTLEEFGLPRMLSKKLHKYGFLNFEDNELSLDEVLEKFQESSPEKIINLLKEKRDFDDFDEYILNYFYEGLGR